MTIGEIELIGTIVGGTFLYQDGNNLVYPCYPSSEPKAPTSLDAWSQSE